MVIRDLEIRIGLVGALGSHLHGWGLSPEPSPGVWFGLGSKQRKTRSVFGPALSSPSLLFLSLYVCITDSGTTPVCTSLLCWMPSAGQQFTEHGGTGQKFWCQAANNSTIALLLTTLLQTGVCYCMAKYLKNIRVATDHLALLLN